MNGIVLINKEKDYTSHDIVNIVKKLTKTKVGHTGTLDPNATGVLPLLLGDATKISKYLTNHDKEYIAVLKLGIKTQTADGEGDILEEREVPKEILEKKFVETILEKFLGKQKQIPPMYSAIKVKGKKLYDYARQGKTVKLPLRDIEIYNIQLINIDNKNNVIIFKVACSKGTYIRTLCEDIAKSLGTVGYMKDLQRNKVGIFNIKDCITISEFEKQLEKNNNLQIISIEEVFKNNEKIELSKNEINKYLNGVKINILDLENIKKSSNENLNEKIYRIYIDNTFIGLGIVKDNKLKRDLVINLKV